MLWYEQEDLSFLFELFLNYFVNFGKICIFADGHDESVALQYVDTVSVIGFEGI